MMDVFLRVIAIFIEVIILAALLGCLLYGVWLAMFDLGLGERYKKAITVVFVIVGCLIVVFLVAHLTTFYPTI